MECHYNVVQYNIMLLAYLLWLRQDMNHSLMSQKTRHFSPERASYGVPYVRFWGKMDRVTTALYFLICFTMPMFSCVLLWLSLILPFSPALLNWHKHLDQSIASLQLRKSQELHGIHHCNKNKKGKYIFRAHSLRSNTDSAAHNIQSYHSHHFIRFMMQNTFWVVDLEYQLCDVCSKHATSRVCFEMSINF